MIRFENIPIGEIEVNHGQIPGLPDNPRKATPEIINKTIESIRQDPEMLELRGVMVFKYNDKYVAIGGNSRLQALRQLQFTHVPCVIIPDNTPIEALRRYIVKDNASFGMWDWDKLTSGWAIDELESWSIEVPPFEDTQEEHKRAGWNSGKDSTESLCDLKEQITWHSKGDISFVSIYRKSEVGFPLSKIKSDDSNIAMFADAAVVLIKKIIGLRCKDNWCIITTPKRRHKEHNFASLTADIIAARLGIPFHDNVISAKTKQRVNPTFTVEYEFPEKNVIIFDDIITTGSTIVATNDCLPNKNCIFIVGINNN